MARRGKLILGQSKDVTFSWVTAINPNLETWRALAEKWLLTVKSDKHTAIMAMGKFLFKYLHEEKMSIIPAEFLSRSYPAKSFYDICLPLYSASVGVESPTEVSMFSLS